MSETLPLPKLSAGSKRTTSAVSAHSRQLHSSRDFPRNCTAPLPRKSRGVETWELGPEFYPREFFESSLCTARGLDAPQGDWEQRKGCRNCRRAVNPSLMCAEWQTCSSITIMDCRGKTRRRISFAGFGVLIQSSEVACFMQACMYSSLLILHLLVTHPVFILQYLCQFPGSVSGH